MLKSKKLEFKGIFDESHIKPNPCDGWAEHSKKLAQSSDNELVWPELINSEDKNLKWV